MNTYVSMPCRELACGAAAALITFGLSATFVESTSSPPGLRSWPPVFVQVQPRHAWFGQPEPAVLVD